MTTQQDNLTALSESMCSFSDYPQNLITAEEFPYALDSYRSRINENEKNVFQSDEGSLTVWDLEDIEDGMSNTMLQGS